MSNLVETQATLGTEKGEGCYILEGVELRQEVEIVRREELRPLRPIVLHHDSRHSPIASHRLVRQIDHDLGQRYPVKVFHHTLSITL